MNVEIAMESHNLNDENPPDDRETVNVRFPQGIIGFPGSKNYALVADPKFFPFFKLVSLDEENVAFALLDPWLAMEDYQFVLSDNDVSNMKIAGSEDIQVFSIATFYNNNGRIGINLVAPVVINRRENIGAQVVLDDTHLPLQHFVEFGE